MGDQSHDKLHAHIENLLTEPITQLAMKADGVEHHETKVMLARVSLAQYPMPPAPGRAYQRYRKGVGIALFNADGQIWVGQRSDIASPAWQLPQGSIDTGESPLQAAQRELREEAGISDTVLLAESEDWLRYDLPPELLGRTWGGQWCGQEQRWIAMRFLGSDADFNVATIHPEFSAWRWADLGELPDLAAPFKRCVYEEIARRFAQFAVSSE